MNPVGHDGGLQWRATPPDRDGTATREAGGVLPSRGFTLAPAPEPGARSWLSHPPVRREPGTVFDPPVRWLRLPALAAGPRICGGLRDGS